MHISTQPSRDKGVLSPTAAANLPNLPETSLELPVDSSALADVSTGSRTSVSLWGPQTWGAGVGQGLAAVSSALQAESQGVNDGQMC